MFQNIRPPDSTLLSALKTLMKIGVGSQLIFLVERGFVGVPTLAKSAHELELLILLTSLKELTISIVVIPNTRQLLHQVLGMGLVLELDQDPAIT
jgi:hypothetical protein